jgi:hypothetical protein
MIGDRMTSKYSIAFLLAVFAAGAALGPSCQAGTINLVLDAQGYHAPSGLTVYLHQTLNGTGSTDVADSADVSQGGSFEWKVVPDFTSSGYHQADFVNPLPITSTNQFLTFCIEINQNISFNNNPAYTYTLASLASAPIGTSEQPVKAPNGNPSGPGMGAVAANLIAELWANHFEEVFGNSPLQGTDSSNLNILAGAFQLAIWKLEYDHKSSQYTDNYGSPGSVDFSKGFLRVSDTNNLIATTAAGWINDLANFKGTAANLVAITSLTQQDQLVELKSTVPFGSPSVPEPASGLIWVVIACLVGIATLTRRYSAVFAA